MAEYIGREEVIDKLTMLFPLLKKKTIKNILKAVPTADVQPVVHGKWIIKNDNFMGYPTVCSVCGRDAITCAWRPVKTPYCPNCGARMDGKCAN